MWEVFSMGVCERYDCRNLYVKYKHQSLILAKISEERNKYIKKEDLLAVKEKQEVNESKKEKKNKFERKNK